MLLLFAPFVSANGVLDVDVASQLPTSVSPGDDVEVVVTVSNVGNSEANNIVVSFVEDNYPFTLLNRDNAQVRINELGSYRDYQIRYRLQVDEDISAGRSNLRLDISRGSSDAVLKKSLPIVIGDSSARLVVDDISIDDGFLSPGEVKTLNITVTNKGSAVVRDAAVMIDIAKEMQGDLIVNDLPFAPLGGSSIISVGNVGAGQSRVVSFDLFSYADASTGLYKMPMSLTYEDALGESFSESIITGIMVDALPSIDVFIDEVSFTGSNSADVTFFVLNDGLADVRLMSVELQNSGSVNVSENSAKQYLGSLDSDDFDTARFSFDFSEDITLPVELTYRDASNNLMTQSFEFELDVPATESSGLNVASILLVVAIFVIGYLLYKRKR